MTPAEIIFELKRCRSMGESPSGELLNGISELTNTPVSEILAEYVARNYSERNGLEDHS